MYLEHSANMVNPAADAANLMTSALALPFRISAPKKRLVSPLITAAVLQRSSLQHGKTQRFPVGFRLCAQTH
jgi:hypothetical protein